MIFFLATHQCFDETSKNTDQHKALVIGAEQLLIPQFSTVLVFGTVLANSGSIFFGWWYNREVMQRRLWLQIAVWRIKTNQLCYYWFLKIFHVLCNGVSKYDVNPNFLLPTYSLLQCRMVWQHLIQLIYSWRMVVVDMNNIRFPFGFVMPVDWTHHCLHMSIAVDTNISFIFPLKDINVTKEHENHFNFSKFLSNYLW